MFIGQELKLMSPLPYRCDVCELPRQCGFLQHGFFQVQSFWPAGGDARVASHCPGVVLLDFGQSASILWALCGLAALSHRPSMMSCSFGAVTERGSTKDAAECMDFWLLGQRLNFHCSWGNTDCFIGLLPPALIPENDSSGPRTDIIHVASWSLYRLSRWKIAKLQPPFSVMPAMMGRARRWDSWDRWTRQGKGGTLCWWKWWAASQLLVSLPYESQ